MKGFLDSAVGKKYEKHVFSAGAANKDVVRVKSDVWFMSPGQDMTDLSIAVEDARNAYGNNGKSCDEDVCEEFIWGEDFLGADTVAVSDKVLLNLMSSALAMLAVICLLFLPPTAAISTVLTIILVNVDIMGLLCLWDVKINSTLPCYLTIALGFSVDFAAHIAESFCLRCVAEKGGVAPEPALAMQRALTTTGGSVLNGGFSTALAVAILSMSATKAFQDMFKTFLLMVVLGLSHGMIMMPIILVNATKIRNRFRK